MMIGGDEKLVAEMFRSFEVNIENHSNLIKTGFYSSINVFVKPKLREAFIELNKQKKWCLRKYSYATFHEARQLVNRSYALAAANSVKLITFDGDDTLYHAGHNFTEEKIAERIAALINRDIFVAIVSAVNYGSNEAFYETRISNLINVINEKTSFNTFLRSNFMFIAGQAAEFFRLDESGKLKHVQSIDISMAYCEKSYNGNADDWKDLLNTAAEELQLAIEEFGLKAKIIKKKRSVGIVPDDKNTLKTTRLTCEILNELSERISLLSKCVRFEQIPCCVFNSNFDVWIDIGNKAIGISFLQNLLKLSPSQTMHIGDQFNRNGNDAYATLVATCIWVINPTETRNILKTLCNQIKDRTVQTFYSSNLINGESETII